MNFFDIICNKLVVIKQIMLDLVNTMQPCTSNCKSQNNPFKQVLKTCESIHLRNQKFSTDPLLIFL